MYFDAFQNFEAWNNLSNAYIKLGQKSRAWKVLQEALKCDYDNWKIWDNIMVVSVDLSHFSDVIAAYHRILDLKGKHVDTEVLRILGQAIASDAKDNQGEPCRKYFADTMKLMGRLTSAVPGESKLWSIYADLASLPLNDPPQPYKACQYRQKAAAAATQKPSWDKQSPDCEEALKAGIRYASDAAEYARAAENKTQAIQLMASAKMTIRGMLTKVKVNSTSCYGRKQLVTKDMFHLFSAKSDIDQDW